jgi:hypothetical protein
MAQTAGCATRLLSRAKMNWTDPISLRLNGMWTAVASLEGMNRLAKPGKIWQNF